MVDMLFVVVRLDTDESNLEIGVLHRVDSPDIELDTGLLLYALDVVVEVFVAGHEQRHHPEVWLLQPSADVLADVLAFPANVRGDDNVLDAELATGARDVPPAEVGHHSPVVSEGNRVELQLLLDDVECVGTIASAAEGYDAVRLAIASSIRLEQRKQLFDRL